MTGTSFIPALIAVLVITRIKKLINSFKDSGSNSPETAKTPEELNVRRSFLFRRLVNRKVFIEAAPGRFYIQEDNLEEYYRIRRMRVLVVFLIILVLILIDVYLFKF